MRLILTVLAVFCGPTLLWILLVLQVFRGPILGVEYSGYCSYFKRFGVRHSGILLYLKYFGVRSSQILSVLIVFKDSVLLML